uniref:Uncharacterized protein n=1 Tax=Panagrolaimus davidi TaxID=227884 RepID=A0A914QQ79_9BILA
MGALNIFSLLFLGAAFIAQSNGAINRFIPMWCVDLHASPGVSTFNSTKDAMQACVESNTCIGFKKTSDNGYQLLRGLTGYTFNETSRDYYLWDKTGGKTFQNQPNELDALILFAIYPNDECPFPFDIVGSLCRGRSGVSREMCYSYPTYMAPQHDGTNCYVLQKQTVINSWA